MLLPGKPTTLMLCQDLLHKCCIPASNHQQGISCWIMLITRDLERYSDLGQVMVVGASTQTLVQFPIPRPPATNQILHAHHRMYSHGKNLHVEQHFPEIQSVCTAPQ